MTTRSKSRAGALALDILNHGALALVALLFLFPFFWMISNAVRSNSEVLAIPVRILPTVFEWDNFAKAWTTLPFGRFEVHVDRPLADPFQFETVAEQRASAKGRLCV